MNSIFLYTERFLLFLIVCTSATRASCQPFVWCDGHRPATVFFHHRQTLERPLYFDPFGQVEFAPVGHNMIAPCKVLVQGSILFYPFRYSGFS